MSSKISHNDKDRRRSQARGAIFIVNDVVDNIIRNTTVVAFIIEVLNNFIGTGSDHVKTRISPNPKSSIGIFAYRVHKIIRES